MGKDKRLCLRVSPKERELIRQKMELCGCSNMSAYIRRMAADSMIINFNTAYLKEISRLLGYIDKNFRQIENNLTGENAVYANDIAAIKEKQLELTDLVRKIYLKLAEL